MVGDTIKYRKGYKYQLALDYTVQVGIFPSNPIVTGWIVLQSDGFLTIFEGYAWDGPSGPTLDTKSAMRGALVHDALYQLMRLGLLAQSNREKADDLLHDICVEDGMMHWRAELWEEMVSHFAEGAARSGSEQDVLEAP